MIVRGRVVDAQGRPVAAAEVRLGHGGIWLPTPATYAPDQLSTTDAAGKYAFDMTSEPWFTELHWPANLRAFLGQRVSHEIVVHSQDASPVPDLVLEAGVSGRVRVLWDDGSPAVGVKLILHLEDRPAAPRNETEDRSADHHAAVGETDEKGEMPFGPAPDHEFVRICVSATHPNVTRQMVECEARRLEERTPLEVVLVRGREVHGTLRTAEGQPAAGYLVASFGRRSGDPERRSGSRTDAAGRFKVRGVDHRYGGIAIYDRLPDPPSAEELAALDDLQVVERMARDVGLATNPLLIHDVRDGDEDLGTITLPEIATLTLRLEDPRGVPVSGYVHWMRSDDRTHGSCAYRADSAGIVRIERMPMGIEAGLKVHVEDSRHGAIEQRFVVRNTRKKPITLRVTGAGTVVVRLHPKGAPDQPLTVHQGCVLGDCHVAHEDGPASELRGRTSPGLHPALKVGAKGFRERVIENVKVSRRGPTFLDVELEPL